MQSLIIDFGKEGKKFKGLVTIKNEIAVFHCDDPRMTKQIYDAESATNKNVSWDSKKKVMIEYYPGKDEEYIKDKIQAELEKLKQDG